MTKSSNPVRRIDAPADAHSAQEQRERLDDVSRGFAREDAATSDAKLDSLTEEAIKEWRLQDATFWQRVKFRSRMLRAVEEGARRKPH